EIWQVGASYDTKPYRGMLMRTFGGKLYRSPGEATAAGRKYVAEDPQHPGSLGIAISEAVEVAAQSEDTRYALGLVLNHVLLHQTVIDEDPSNQKVITREPLDVITGHTGSMTMFVVLAPPLLHDRLPRHLTPDNHAHDHTACPVFIKR